MRTTAAHFKYFESRCRHWIDRLSLNDYDWFIMHGGSDADAMATFWHNHTGKQVTIKFSSVWNTLISRAEMDRVAFHEIFESYLVRLENIAEARDSKQEIEAERHAIVHRVWHALKG